MHEIQVTGMSCGHCQKAVFEAVSAVPGTSAVKVELTTGLVRWEGAENLTDAVKKAITAIGFQVK